MVLPRLKLILPIMALFFLLACFRDGQKKESAESKPLLDEITGPLAFALNQPLVDINSEPVVLSWSPSSGAVSYDAKVANDASCQDSLSHSPSLIHSNMEISDLAEGSYFFCVVATSESGEFRGADNNGVAFNVDRTPPKAIVDQMPSLLDNPTAIKVKGDGLSSYRFKATPSSLANCSEDKDYSNGIQQSELIVVEITGQDQEWTLCLLGEDQAGNQQALSDVTVYQWSASATGRRYAFNLTTVIGASTFSGDEINIKGTGISGWNDGQNPKVTLRQVATGTCLNSSKSAFDALCPNFISVTGSDWQFDVAESLLTAGDAYEVIAQVDDVDVGRRTAGIYRFFWRYGYHSIHSTGRIRIGEVSKLSNGDFVIAGEVAGSLSKGVVAVAPPEIDQSSDWFVAKNQDDGTPVWTQRYDGSGTDPLRDMVVDAAGDIYLLGLIGGNVTNGLGIITGKGERDLLLMKVKGSDGTPVWMRGIQSTADEETGGLALASDGSITVSGSVCGDTDFGSGTAVTVSSCDVFLANYAAADGSLSWVKNFTGSSVARAWNMTVDSDGNYYMVGDIWGSLTFEATTLTSAGGYDGFVAKFSSTGTLTWVVALTGSQYERVKGISHDGSDLFVSAESTGESSFNGGSSLGTADLESLLVYKLSPVDGSVSWSKIFTGASGVASAALDVSAISGHVYVTAIAEGDLTLGEFSLVAMGQADLVFAELSSSDGSIVEARLVGDVGSDVGGDARSALSGSEVYFSMAYSWDPPRLGKGRLPYVYYQYTGVLMRYRP